MAGIDTSYAQTREQREAAYAKQMEEERLRRLYIEQLRREAEERWKASQPTYQPPAPVAPVAPIQQGSPMEGIAPRTALDELLEAQIEGFRTPAQQKAYRALPKR